MMVERAWRPVLTGLEAEAARGVALKIIEALTPFVEDRSLEAGLQLGSAGLAVTLAEVARLELADTTDVASAALNVAAEAVSEQALGAGFQSGLAGIGWAVQHVTGDGDACEEVDALILEHVLVTARGDAQLFEANGGLVGFGIYGLERMPSPAGRAIVEAVLERLPDNAVESAEGMGWRTPAVYLPEAARKHAPEGHFNLGLPHGTPGVLAFLAAVIEAGLGGGAAQNMAREGARWLFAQANSGGGRSAFPDLIRAGTPSWGTGHYGWCYGSPAVATALVTVGQALGDAGILEAGRKVAIDAAQLRPPTPDAILCHGTGGLQLIFQRLWQRTDAPACEDAARYWARATLALQGPAGEGLAGFTSARAWERPEAPSFVDPSLFVGASGTALTLLAAVGDQPPDWDRALLLSARTAAEL